MQLAFELRSQLNEVTIETAFFRLIESRAAFGDVWITAINCFYRTVFSRKIESYYPLGIVHSSVEDDLLRDFRRAMLLPR